MSVLNTGHPFRLRAITLDEGRVRAGDGHCADTLEEREGGDRKTVYIPRDE